jgi:colanic acid/amylovoran biosynthesis glycosyltransferase
MNAARQAYVKHVVTFYGLDVNFLPRQDPRWRSRYRALFDHIDLVLCEGSFMRRCIIELGCPETKVRVQHLGIRIDQIPFIPRVWQPGEPLRILMAASFREKKGLPYALEALGQIQESVDLEITLIGDADSEPRNQNEKRKILSAIERHRFKNVRLPGYQPQQVLMDEAYAHHIFLSPSVTASDGDTEGGAPVSLIEMTASGMMVVSTEHCDIPEVVQHEKTGLLAAERNVEELVALLQWLIAHPERWRAMAEAGKLHVSEQYSAEIQGQRLATMYQDLAAA